MKKSILLFMVMSLTFLLQAQSTNEETLNEYSVSTLEYIYVAVCWIGALLTTVVLSGKKDFSSWKKGVIKWFQLFFVSNIISVIFSYLWHGTTNMIPNIISLTIIVSLIQLLSMKTRKK